MAATVAYESGEWDLSVQLTAHRGERAPATQAAALDAAGLYVAAARGQAVPDELLRRVRRHWAADGLIAIQSAAGGIEVRGFAGDLEGAVRTHDEAVEFLRALWHTDHIDAEVRLGALLLGHMGTAAATMSSADRAAVADEGDRVLASARGVWPEDGDTVPGLEGRAWLARLAAEGQRLAWLAGRSTSSHDDIVAAWTEAAALFDERGDPYEWARSMTRLAACQTAAGRAEEGRRAAERARATAERLGARPLLRELDAIHPAGGPRIAREPRAGARAVHLTPRELEVLRLLEQGRTNGQIGSALFISVKTASVHVSNILAKLGAESRGEAAAIARSTGLLAREPTG